MSRARKLPESFRAAVRIDYTNYRGERAWRWVLPKRIEFGWNEWHQEPQWLLTALDLDKDAEREFAMKDIHAWMPRIRAP